MNVDVLGMLWIILRLFILSALFFVVVVGLIISDRFITVAVDHLTMKHYIVWSCVLLLAGVAIFYTLLLFGMDPFWSFHLAKRWCSNPDWIHLNTTLLYALVRDSASLFG